MREEEAEAIAAGGPRLRPEYVASLREAEAVVPSTASPPTPASRAQPPTPAIAPPPAVAAEEKVPEAAEPPKLEYASSGEVALHAAEDSIFFCRHFFPKAFRQESAPFHPEVWAILDDPIARYVNLQLNRGGAKTTILRAYMAKRIAYGLSRTILYIGASEKKARASVKWLQAQVMYNKKFAGFFGLERGDTWTGEEIQIRHGGEGHNVTVIALGITGSVRGINIDDYRPDLIVVDDCINDDNAATDLQRIKINDRILGAVKESLVPPSEVPDAKLVIINTPQDYEDLSQLALKDPQFRSARYGCWTHETEDLPLEFQESSWPARWSSEYWRAEKTAAIARNMLSTFARENECRLITPETASFRPEWIKYYGAGEIEPEPPRHEMWVELIIDPVPPPTQIQIAKGLTKKDFEALTVMGRWRNKYYVLESIYNRGHEPNWTVATFFELCNRWNPRKVIVEAIAYQATLAWLLREAMKRSGRFWMIEEFKDKRAKIDRIKDGISGPSSNGALFLRRSQTTAISQITHFPGKNPTGTFDDVIETIAIGCASLSKGFVGDVAEDNYKYTEESIPALENYRGAP